MNAHTPITGAPNARDWMPVLSRYRQPSEIRSLFEIAVSVGPFLLLWALGWWALSAVGPWLALPIALVNGAFLVRIFCVQHDLGHSTLFADKRRGDWIGRALGVLTVTPYDVWRRIHAMHHGASGNLTRRPPGEVYTMTAAEFRAQSRWGRLRYRLYRHPLTLFGFAPAWCFLIENRLPLGLMRAGASYWISAMGTNLAVLAVLGTIWALGGVQPILWLFLPTTLCAATIGVWLFYVQHQFEESHFAREPHWDLHEAALHGSSHYDLPRWAHWLTANIGLHHIHHLNSRIPFYRLPDVLAENPGLEVANRLTLRESFACVKLKLWCERQRRLVTFREALAPAAA